MIFPWSQNKCQKNSFWSVFYLTTCWSSLCCCIKLLISAWTSSGSWTWISARTYPYIYCFGSCTISTPDLLEIAFFIVILKLKPGFQSTITILIYFSSVLALIMSHQLQPTFTWQPGFPKIIQLLIIIIKDLKQHLLYSLLKILHNNTLHIHLKSISSCSKYSETPWLNHRVLELPMPRALKLIVSYRYKL